MRLSSASCFSSELTSPRSFLANIQRNGTFSVVPRIAGGEVAPEGLILIGQVAKEYGLYTKITGGTSLSLRLRSSLTFSAQGNVSTSSAHRSKTSPTSGRSSSLAGSSRVRRTASRSGRSSRASARAGVAMAWEIPSDSLSISRTGIGASGVRTSSREEFRDACASVPRRSRRTLASLRRTRDGMVRISPRSGGGEGS